MKSVLRVVGGLLALLLVVVAGLLVGARFADGPIAIIAGGPFTSGELVSGPEPDWSFVGDVREVEFQLLDPARSRTTWILYHEGKPYIPCGYMTTWWGKIWKQWPAQALRDGRAVIRIEGKRYERQLVRILNDLPLLEAIAAEVSRKYGAGLRADNRGAAWVGGDGTADLEWVEGQCHVSRVRRRAQADVLGDRVEEARMGCGDEVRVGDQRAT